MDSLPNELLIDIFKYHVCEKSTFRSTKFLRIVSLFLKHQSVILKCVINDFQACKMNVIGVNIKQLISGSYRDELAKLKSRHLQYINFRLNTASKFNPINFNQLVPNLTYFNTNVYYEKDNLSKLTTLVLNEHMYFLSIFVLNKYPPNLTYLKINNFLFPVPLSNTIKKLVLGNILKQEIKIWPTQLRYLKIKNWYQYDIDNLPDTIVTISLSADFKGTINNWPSNLRYLSTPMLQSFHIPESLIYLAVYENTFIRECHLPKSISELVIDTNLFDSHLPPNIKKLTLGKHYCMKNILQYMTSLTHLIVRNRNYSDMFDIYNTIVTMASLTHLSIILKFSMARLPENLTHLVCHNRVDSPSVRNIIYRITCLHESQLTYLKLSELHPDNQFPESLVSLIITPYTDTYLTLPPNLKKLSTNDSGQLSFIPYGMTHVTYLYRTEKSSFFKNLPKTIVYLKTLVQYQEYIPKFVKFVILV